MYYGFDVGGTKIEFGAFNEKLERVATERVPTPTDNYELLVDTIADLISKYDAEFGCEGTIGLGLPGMEDADDATVLTVNVPAAKGKPLRADLEAKIGRSVKIENDANCFALSEAWDEDLQGEPSVLGLILGTGFGGGFIYEGKVFSGRNHVAGEVGHMRLPIDAWFHLGDNAPLLGCGCGKKGCLDSYLSGRGFELIYAHYFGEQKKAIDIIKAYGEGEASAVEHVERFMELLAICLGNIFTATDPNVVVLGGGLSNFDLIYEEMPKRIPKHLLSVAKCPKIIKAKHGDSGGVRGAAFLNIK
ncbi:MULTISPECIES: N-acetylglucosamine kinase [Vibrio]|jgi:N-acetylglucosamine kinase|uniref:N-acetyl-D-glucosamine kinase n=1 Tax=Vibrio natriegens NBRC 15636 = ATCC 14048 = DSM 759 TaxID=1219067 RepID=A0AAN0Y3F0_VIBNA|nr:MULTISPECIES: N-acetylglucosamine kinase [Vibrio]MEE3877951.1 N-acetylglucosamine kinase [Vibrio sp. YYF0003]AEX21918.1 N-acetyl-D-glucosamine kinase [Vibrio sp. EJY3]ALR15546.1 N-acetylglucosamine kinase [Vibrio natriegens NBRC 15636 = ATCC 14048 = DSM 759]ANQ12595.1 N-acetylglucosamine kinase [Vibrio natriegens NBRC 15636 = ATCC 14048 = DSM 759]ANQ17244.1 N-acetylglucosamine kinase [Vibrio natriegens]